jgi:hypothetical protein
MSTRFENNFYKRDGVAIPSEIKYQIRQQINPSMLDLIKQFIYEDEYTIELILKKKLLLYVIY